MSKEEIGLSENYTHVLKIAPNAKTEQLAHDNGSLSNDENSKRPSKLIIEIPSNNFTTKYIETTKPSTSRSSNTVQEEESLKSKSLISNQDSRKTSQRSIKATLPIKESSSVKHETSSTAKETSNLTEKTPKIEFSLTLPDSIEPDKVTIEDPKNETVNNIAENNNDNNRPTWNNKIQCFLSIIGFCVGLGNIWRFPYLCQENGGGAFLIPYFLMLIVEGMPLFLIEIGLGQKLRHGALGVWNIIHPWSAGLGIASGIVAFSVALYYNVIIAWCVYYLYHSLLVTLVKINSDLPWASCPSENGTVVQECMKSSETAYFWYRYTLDISPSIDDGNSLKYWIVISFLFSWILVYCVVMKGINSSKYVVYFTSLFPYLILTIFLIRGLSLEGAKEGLIHMATPKIEKLMESKVWLDAATQVFYSFGLAFGSLIAFGSYNEPKNNCVRDVIYITICNGFTAIFATTVVFSVLGYKAMNAYKGCIADNYNLLQTNNLLSAQVSQSEYEKLINSNDFISANITLKNCSLESQLDSVAQGTGMAFIVFTQAILELPVSRLWSCAFFLMLLSLGLGSQIGILEGVLSIMSELKLFKQYKKQHITAIVCVVSFFIGLIFCMGSGEYWVQIFDSFAGTIGLVFIAFTEMMVVSYVYGSDEFSDDIYDMTGYRPGLFWQIVWKYVGPMITFLVLIINIYSMCLNSPTYDVWDPELGQTVATKFPTWILVIAVCIVAVGITPVFFIYCYRRYCWFRTNWRVMPRNQTTISTRAMMESAESVNRNRDAGFLEEMNIRRRRPEPHF